MKRYWIAVLVVAMALIFTQGAFAQGNFYIPGSADNIGGLGQDGKSFNILHINNTVTFEGTPDTNEGRLIAPDVGSDIDWHLPATAGTLAVTSSLFNTTLEDGKILIGNFSDEAIPYTPSGDWTITNAGVASLAADSVDSANISIANVQASDVFFNTVTVTIQAGATGGDTTIENGSLLLAVHPLTGFSNIYTLTKSVILGSTLIINTDAHPVAMVMNAVTIRP